MQGIIIVKKSAKNMDEKPVTVTILFTHTSNSSFPEDVLLERPLF